jgi:hypothetical protein
MVSITLLDETKVEALGNQTEQKPKRKKRIMARVVCDLCHLEVNKKSLKVHQDSSRCRLRTMEMALARISQQQQQQQPQPPQQAEHPPVLRPIAVRISPTPVREAVAEAKSPQMLVSFASNPNPGAKPFFKPRQTRVRPVVPSVAKTGAMLHLREWLITVKSVSEATANGAIGALRKILANKYGDSRVLTKQELYLGVIDVVNFQQFMAHMEASGM